MVSQPPSDLASFCFGLSAYTRCGGCGVRQPATILPLDDRRAAAPGGGALRRGLAVVICAPPGGAPGFHGSGAAPPGTPAQAPAVWSARTTQPMAARVATSGNSTFT